MPNVFSVFNIGTSHKRTEPNNTIADLYKSCAGQAREKYINDGPGLLGFHMDAICKTTVEAIIASGANILNLTGHSRGGILCHMIANEIVGRRESNVCQVNMIVLDPVDKSKHKQTGSDLRCDLINNYIMIAMENVTHSKIFPLEIVTAPGYLRARMLTLNMPGTHGSGTQCLTSAIGGATRAMIMWAMAAWGTKFKESVPTNKQISELFAAIHIENPAKYTPKGTIGSRSITDDGKGMAISPFSAGIKTGDQKVGRVQQLTNHFNQMSSGGGGWSGKDFETRLYFLNAFHAGCFKSAFPGVYARLDGNLQNQATVNMELREIEGAYPMITKSLKMFGAL